ncbi:MAG: peptidoglycan-binding domain-containing protein, partial [Candidatus Nomurabacteria bacterium]|nr:peptidoglycan-binding domain-containing protein [Candidatus Nomurabacteria bacterium]
MNKYIISVLLLSACFSFTSAQTMGDLPPPDNGSQCTDLKYNLTYTKSKDSNTNGEVSDLQFFLQDSGLLDSDPTGYFGKLTFNAVKAFQRQNNLYAYGYVGPQTRALIKSLSCNANPVICNSESYINAQGVCTPITHTCPDGRVIAGMLSCDTAVAAQSINITSPNGGEVWNIGGTYNINYQTTSNQSYYVYLEKGRPTGDLKPGPSSTSLLGNTIPGATSFSYIIPQLVATWPGVGSNYKISLCPIGYTDQSTCPSGLGDTSNNYFTITDSTSCSGTGTVTPGNKTVVAGVSGGSVWGNGANNIFSSDSSLGSIAQFLGAKVGSTVNLIVADAGCKSTFGGSVTQSGVTTVSYTSPWRGMTVTLGSCLSNCASTAAAPTVSWSPSSSTITSGQSNPAYSYTSVGQTRNCVIYDPSTATASYPGTVLWNSVEATHTFPAGLLGTITQNLSRKLVCFNDSGVGSTPATYTITVANSATPTIIITSPQPNANFKIGDNIPISWTYSGVPRNSQVVYSITGINTTGSGVEGGTGQSNELSVNSTSGSAVWRTGGNGYLNVPGTYAVSATINECNPSGCSYAPSGKILSTVQNSVRITIDSPSTVVTTPTLNSFNVVTSTSGTVRKDETFSMNWSGSNATRFEYNVNYGTAYTT